MLLAVWAASAAVTVRRRSNPPLARACTPSSAPASCSWCWPISRIFGTVWYYLTLWGWAVGLLALVATAWTAADVVGERWSAERRARTGKRAMAAVVGVALLATLRFTVDAWNSPHADATVARDLAAVVDDAAAGLDADGGAGHG